MAGLTNIDITQLPKPDFVETVDAESILKQRKEKILSLAKAQDTQLFNALQKIINLESEPVNIVVQENTYNETVLRTRINHAALATTKAFATGEDLDVIAANDSLTRHIVQEADNDASPPIPKIMESDESLRHRAFLAPDKITTAGSAESYEAHALDASGKVKAVRVTSPSPAHIVIYVLSTEGDGTADKELCDLVYDYLSAKKLRPLSDRLQVFSVEVVHFDIEVAITVNSLPEIEIILPAAKKALEDFTKKNNAIGEEVNRSAINRAAFVEGVKKVDVIQPANDLVLLENQVGFCDSINVEKAK